MLVIAALGCWAVFRLAADFLCPDRRAAYMTVALLCLSPLYFSQSAMALLDMPAMVLTSVALLLFLRERLVGAAAACMALVMVKETGALLPAVLGIVLVREHRPKESAWFLLPAAPLAIWLLLLHEQSGNWFGNAVFAQYNLKYPLNPVRLGLAVFRRGYYLFVSTGYLIGTIAVLKGRTWNLRSRAWKVASIFALVHFVSMCVIGGAVLERYLLPVLPIVLAAFANALCALRPMWRKCAFAGMCACSAICIVVNPIYPFPLENNLAWSDFVAVQHDAAEYISAHVRAGGRVASSFPFAGCMRRPEFGYTAVRFQIEDVPDFTPDSLQQLRGRKIDALAVFTSTWDPMKLERNAHWVAFLKKFYSYERDVSGDEVTAMLGLHRVARFERHGQWIEVYQP